MKTQILIIGGGNTSLTNEEYVEYIKTKPIYLDAFRNGENWKNSLQTVLGESYDVLIPPMPNNWNARFSEWKIWFERIIPILAEEIVLIGHSLGGIFLAKYLSENKVSKKIKTLFLLAAPYLTTTDQGYFIADFVLTNKLDKVSEQVSKIFIYHSEDDQIVPVICAKRYNKDFPEAKVRIFKDYRHLNIREFPEIIEDLRSP